MIYSSPCDCGNRIKATSVQAGTEITCDCGRMHRIPLLSEFRQMMGQDAYRVGTVGEINRMIRDGELPWGTSCAISGMPTSDSYDFYVQYEFTWAQRTRKPTLYYIFFILFLPFWIIWLILFFVYRSTFDAEGKVLGHNKEVCLPLRVHKEFHEKLSRTRSQRKLRQCLRTVPVYDQLFKEYPQAKVFT